LWRLPYGSSSCKEKKPSALPYASMGLLSAGKPHRSRSAWTLFPSMGLYLVLFEEEA
jgi:hypothetical protein